MTRTVTLVQARATPDRIVYRVMSGDRQVGTAVELAHDRVAPWRLTIPSRCANLRRSSRMVLIQTVERLLDIPPAPSSEPARRSVVYVPAAPGSQWEEIAAELIGAGFEVRPAPIPDVPRIGPVPVVVTSREG
jgi:hypothetical protein